MDGLGRIAPFILTYWQHIVALFLGIILAQLFGERRSDSSGTGEDVKITKTNNAGIIREKDIQCEPPTNSKTPGNDGDTEDHPDQDAFDQDHGKHIPYSMERYSEEEMKRRASDFYLQMNKRRSVRFFSDEHVPLEVMENIIRTAGIHYHDYYLLVGLSCKMYINMFIVYICHICS